MIDAIAALVEPLGAGPVGVGMPGFVDGGVVRGSPNFPGWVDVDLQGRLSERLGVPVRVDNDANCAALGAWDGEEELILLTLGTGVGGGVISHSHLLRGACGVGAEVGHIPVGGDQPCNCGGVGCLETWCSTAGLRARSGRDVDGEAIVAAARSGEVWARSLLDEAATALGRGLVTLTNLFNPDRILIVGGLAGARDLLGPPAEAWLRARGVRPATERVRIEWGGRADELAIRGAAALAAGRGG